MHAILAAKIAYVAACSLLALGVTSYSARASSIPAHALVVLTMLKLNLCALLACLTVACVHHTCVLALMTGRRAARAVRRTCKGFVHAVARREVVRAMVAAAAAAA